MTLKLMHTLEVRVTPPPLCWLGMHLQWCACKSALLLSEIRLNKTTANRTRQWKTS
jgi:hypothetical protein